MTRKTKKKVNSGPQVKSEPPKILEYREIIENETKVIVDQAKLLATGKIRNVYDLEMAARKLMQAEKDIELFQRVNNQ